MLTTVLRDVLLLLVFV